MHHPFAPIDDARLRQEIIFNQLFSREVWNKTRRFYRRLLSQSYAPPGIQYTFQIAMRVRFDSVNGAFRRAASPPAGA
jgi:hypothetical protein